MRGHSIASTLPELTGIDPVDGLARSMEDVELYASILLEFYQRYEHASDSLRSAAERQDLKEVAFLVHKLKGVLGTIGARAAFVAAETLESTMSETNSSMETAAFEHFDTSLNEVLAGLTRALPTLRTLQPPGDPIYSESGPSIDAQLTALAKLVEECDIEAAGAFHSLAPALNECVDKSLIARCRKAFDELDFDAAAVLIREIRAGAAGNALEENP